MVSCCNRRLYKGNSYEICLPLVDSGVTLVRFYTKGDVIIEKEPEISGDSMCFSFTAEELASLEDGVLRYEIVTDQETKDTNSPYVVVTPGDYSGSTLDDLLEDAFDSGYTAGQEDCSGETIHNQSKTFQIDGKNAGLWEYSPVYSFMSGGTLIGNVTVKPDSGYTGLEDVQIFMWLPADEAIAVGYQQGVAEQKGKLSSTAITQNGTFRNSDSGWSSVTVNVPQTGHTDQEMQDSWDSGYTSGKTDGYESGYTAGQEDCSGSSCNLQERKVVNFSELTWSYKPKAPWVAPQYTISGGPLYVSADSGYDGLIEVVVGGKLFVREAYDDGYGNGYQSGYTAGQETCSGGSCEGIWEDGYDSGYTDGSESVDCTPYYESGVTDGYQSGYTSGHTDGFNEGYDSGNTDGFESGYVSGFTDGHASGVTDGFDTGYNSGYTDGVNSVHCTGYTQADLDAAYSSGLSVGYSSGYTDGQADCSGSPIYSASPLQFNIISSGTISWKSSNSSITRTIEYKLNDGDWTSITSTSAGTVLNLSSGDTIWFRGDNSNYGSGLDNYVSFDKGSYNTALYDISGNIMSLIDSTNYNSIFALTDADTFLYLFSETKVHSAKNLLLPAMSLSHACYRDMFYRCTLLVDAPELPATHLAEACYFEMFKYCHSLMEAQEILPACELVRNCYSDMFYGCSGLTTAPILPAENLNISELSGDCYEGMFWHCQSLNYVKCLLKNTRPAPHFNISNWLDDVSPTGTFVKHPDMNEWPTGANGIPSGWTIVDESGACPCDDIS